MMYYCRHIQELMSQSCIFKVYSCQLPETLPVSLPERHGSKLTLVVFFNTTLLPVLALLINLLLATDKIGALGVDKLGLLEDLPDNKEDDGITVAEVAGDETLSAPGVELVEADENERDGTQEQADVGSVGVEGGDVVQSRVVETLRFASAVPADEDDDHHGVGGDETGCGEVNEPEEDGDGGLAGDEEGDAAEETDYEDTVHGYTGLVTLHEESRGLTIASKTVESSGRGVEVGVTTRKTGCEDEKVDQIGKTMDTEVLNWI